MTTLINIFLTFFVLTNEFCSKYLLIIPTNYYSLHRFSISYESYMIRLQICVVHKLGPCGMFDSEEEEDGSTIDVNCPKVIHTYNSNMQSCTMHA